MSLNDPSIISRSDDFIFGSYYRRVLCRRFQSRDECLRLVDDPTHRANPNVMAVDAGDVFVGGRYHSLVPILREVYSGGEDYYHSVAVVKKGTMANIRTTADLRGVSVCFPGVGSLAGWTMPIHELMKQGVMRVVDCNNHIRSAIEFFGPSCAVNSLQDRWATHH